MVSNGNTAMQNASAPPNQFGFYDPSPCYFCLNFWGLAAALFLWLIVLNVYVLGSTVNIPAKWRRPEVTENWGVSEIQQRAASTTEGLLVFLRQSAELRRRAAPGMSGLLRFFDRTAALLRMPHTIDTTEPVRPPLDAARFRDVLSVLGDSVRRAPPNIAPINVWSIAGLRRDELRNARVLAWFLDPRGSHGFGAVALSAFLAEVTRRTPGWPNFGGDLSRVTVVTEEWPLGSETDRVDIAINGPDFALFVEVKIDASEGPDQLRRYTDLIERKALAFDRKHGRLIYLSPRVPENPPSGLGHITWRGVSDALSTLPGNGMSGALAAQFARHVRAFF